MSAHSPGDGNVVNLDDRRKDERPVQIGQKIAERAMAFDGLGSDASPRLDDEVTQLAAEVAAIQTRLAYLRGAVEPRSLAGFLLGLIGNGAEDMRAHIPPLRQALKDEEGAA